MKAAPRKAPVYCGVEVYDGAVVRALSMIDGVVGLVSPRVIATRCHQVVAAFDEDSRLVGVGIWDEVTQDVKFQMAEPRDAP